LVFKKGRKYATTWLERAEDIRWSHSYRTIGGIQYHPIDCCVEALKRDPGYAEAWCKLGSEITGMDKGKDTDKTLIGMDLFKDEPKITHNTNTNTPLVNAAVFCFDKAIEIKPKYVDAWYQKGLWYTSWLHYDKEKIECFLEVTKLDPSISKAWHSLANAHANLLGYDGNFGKALKCYDEAINKAANDKCVVADAADLYDVFTDKADLLSECVGKDERWYNDTDSDLKKKYSSGKDALMCYDKALEIDPKYSYASYKKGMLLKQLSRYEEALECFENVSYSASDWVRDSMNLQRQALRDKLKPHEAGSKEAFETYCRVLGNLLEKDDLDRSEVEFARKKLNENILQHIHKLDDYVTEDDVWEMGEWLQDTGREKEALEFYDKHIEKSLEKGELEEAVDANTQKARYFENKHLDKDTFDCYERTIQLCEKSKGDLDGSTPRYLAEAYVNNARTFSISDNMDKAMEYIDHAIKLERENSLDEYEDYWRYKMDWLPADKDAIKFLDEEIKAVSSSSMDKEEKKRYTQSMKDAKNELLKKLAK